MSAEYTPKVGDRVRVVIEGEVTAPGARRDGGFWVGTNCIRPRESHVVSVERLPDQRTGECV